MIDPDDMQETVDDPRAEMCAEIARLQQEVEYLSAGVDYYEEVLMLRAENKRLKAALGFVADQAAAVQDMMTGEGK